jgi:50S ribosomal protein L16 3-hydroxylase
MVPAESPASTLLGGLSPRAFLRRHWQKRPLLVRGAWPGFHDPVTPARLLALARRADVDSRLVRERGGTRPFQVVPGPLAPTVVRSLGRSHWTVLVHSVDSHVPAVADLLERFGFLPRWRVDDVMVSLAARQGSVGPHVDGYDVFLLQGRGRRRWRIARHFAEEYRPGLDLRVLRPFRPEREWVLEPGDMLYLPPGVAHHGVALEECLTYSIGFRAPAEIELVAGLLQRVVAALDRSRLYADPDLQPTRRPGEISPAALARMRRIVDRAYAGFQGVEFDRFAGEHLTAGRAQRVSRRRRMAAAALRRALRAGASLVRTPGTRIAFLRRGKGALLFAEGRHWALPPPLAAAAPPLTHGRRVPPASLRSQLGRRGFVDLLAELVNAGVFRLEPSPSPAEAARGRRGSRRATGSSRTAAPR